MNDFPSFPFFAADWLSDEKVQTMSMAGEGCYIRLLAYQWREGSIPADRSAIVLLCKANDGSAIDEALAHFQQLSRHPDRLINLRLERERKKLESFRKAKQIAGLKGADNRWHSHNLPLTKNGSSSSSSYKNKSRDLYSGQTEFNQFWESYPNKEAKDVAFEAFRALRKKEPLETIARAFNGYMDFLKNERIRNNFDRRPMNASTFLHKNRWKDFLDFKYEAPL